MRKWQRWLVTVRAFLNAMYGLQGEDEARFRQQIQALKARPGDKDEKTSEEIKDDYSYRGTSA